MGKYFLQTKVHSWDDRHWTTFSNRPYDTLEEAKAAMALKPFPSLYRIVEAHTVTRYKAVKI